MRLARCDACGAKALMAASQCPKCGHYLGLRNEDGDLVPMARCRGCACYYPRRQGSCRWCEDTQDPAPRTPTVRWGVGGLAAAGLIWTAARVFGGSPAEAASETRSLAAAGTLTPPPVASLPVAEQDAARDSAPSYVTAPPTTTTTRPAPDERTSRPATAPAVAPAPRPISQPTRAAASVTKAARAAASVPEPDTVQPFPGEQGTARTWVNVRAGTGMDSPVIGIITPDTRVRFGRSRGGWIEVRTPRFEGWADRRLFLLVR